MKLGSKTYASLITTLVGSADVWPKSDQAKPAIEGVRRASLGALDWFGGIAEFFGWLTRAAVKPPYEGREMLRQMDEIGAKSLPLVVLAGAAIGVVLSLHTRDSLTQFGAESMLPALIILSLVKESGPIITALVVSGRVGAVSAPNWVR